MYSAIREGENAVCSRACSFFAEPVFDAYLVFYKTLIVQNLLIVTARAAATLCTNNSRVKRCLVKIDPLP